MTPERWKRVEEIYHAAMERAPAERGAFLAEACGADADLRREVESLLAEDGGLAGIIDQPAIAFGVLQHAAKPAAGSQLGPYRIEASIGKGGMGEVWKARDSRLNRDVAIKFSAQQFSGRFGREARAVASLNHTNICTVYDVGPNYLVMEFVEGPTLGERIRRGPIPLAEALDVARQVANALESAHEKGIVHRDLKPANIKIRADGSVKVLDFGLATTASPGGGADSHTMTMTTPGMIMGTPGYMSPEQARGEKVDKRADIWAFGVVLYEMVTGRRLFGGNTASEILAAVIKEEPDWQLAPAKVQRLLRACLEKDPLLRLRDIGDVGRLLEENAPTPTALSRSRLGITGWIVAGAASLLFLYLRQPKAPPPEVLRFELRAPDDTSFGIYVSISPDGRRIAYVAVGGGEAGRRIWIRTLDSLETRPLEGTEGGGFFWLPDSRTLVFWANGKLQKIDVTGGPAQPICDFSLAGVGGGFLTADNRLVFGTNSGLQACPANGGVVQAISTFEPDGQEIYHAYPTLLPDGRHFLFMRAAGPKSGIYVGSLDRKPQEQTSQRLLPDSSAAVYVAGPAGSLGKILFVRESTLMAQAFDAGKLELAGDAVPVAQDIKTSCCSFSASSSEAGGSKLVYLTTAGKAQLTWLDRQGKNLGVIGGPGRPFANMRISPDGTRLAANRAEPGTQPDVWVVNLAQGSETRLTTDAAWDGAPVWSPDGKRIAFVSNREGADNFYVRAADGSGSDELLLKSGERKSPGNWSPDGRFLLFSVLKVKTRNDIWVLPMDAGPTGERKAIPYVQTAASETSPRFSPDGRFVAYTSNESGSVEVYVRPYNAASPEVSGSGAGKVRVSTNGGGIPFWRSDGKELAYATEDRKWWSVDVTLQPEFRAGPPRLMGQFPQGTCVPMPDLSRILCSLELGAQTSATVVLNWQAGLKK